MKRFISLCLAIVAISACSKNREDQDQIIYPTKPGTYIINGSSYSITDLDSYSYTIVRNCLDYSVVLTIGFISDSNSLIKKAYKLAPNDSLQYIASVFGAGDSFYGSDYFSIDFGDGRILTRDVREESMKWPIWYDSFLTNYKKAEEVYDYTKENLNGKVYTLAYKVWTYLYNIDENTLKYLSSE